MMNTGLEVLRSVMVLLILLQDILGSGSPVTVQVISSLAPGLITTELLGSSLTRGTELITRVAISST